MTAYNQNIINDLTEAVENGTITAEYVVSGCMHWLQEDGIDLLLSDNEIFSNINSLGALLDAFENGKLEYQMAMQVMLNWIGVCVVNDMINNQLDFDGISDCFEDQIKIKT